MTGVQTCALPISSFMGKVSDRRHDSMVALIGGIKGEPQEAIEEMPSYELFKWGSGTLLLLREGGLFVRVDGEEVRIPGEEGPAVLRAVFSGQAPEGIASSDRTFYLLLQASLIYCRILLSCCSFQIICLQLLRLL